MTSDTLGVGIAVNDPAGRPLPTSTMQLAGHATSAVVEGLSSNRAPWMLGIVILNCLGIAAAVYFLNVLITGQQSHLKSLLEVQQQQTTELLTMHKAEFDALLEMARSNAALLARLPADPFPQQPPLDQRRSPR
jgi:glucan phosphoethanolaminetransferase (alkaline phosphatase superfamily)